MTNSRTVIVTGASQGIGAGVAQAFLARGYNVVGTSRNATKSVELQASDRVALVDGDIGLMDTAQRVVKTALDRFGSIHALVANAGIYFSKPFTSYTPEDLGSLVSTNIQGFLFVAQLSVQQMLSQKTGGSIVAITTSLAQNPIAGIPVSVPMMTKGGLEAMTRNLAIEYAKEAIRFNAVAPGPVDTPLHANSPVDFLRTLSPMGTISSVKDVADAVVYLTEAGQITGEVLHVDGGAHRGRW